MNNIIIFGASKNGLRIKRDLESIGYKITFFCDNNKKKVGNIFDGVEIISYQELAEKVDFSKSGAIVIAVRNPETIVDQIRESQIHVNVYGIIYEYLCKEHYKFQSIDNVLYEIDVKKPRLKYFEYHVAHHCDLNCKGCGHYSNIADPCFGNLDKYKADILRLKELYWGVQTIRLMGGEPLLNKQLMEFCIETRKVFPDARIRVATNGLMIPRVNEKLLQVMKENYIGFDISQYPPTQKVKEKIELRCLEYGVEFDISSLKQKFYIKQNRDGNADPKQEYEKCLGKQCHYLEDGKISICNTPRLYEKYKDKIEVKREISEGDIIDIYDDSLDGFCLNELLSKPIQFCKYCSFSNLEWFEWEGNYTQII